MLSRIVELLERCKSKMSVFPPTELYNEGWLLRLILDWFDRNRDLHHALSFLTEARWYSEALLPSQFLPRWRGDPLGEAYTHADGVIGHFSIAPGVRGEAILSPESRQFVVIEAKLGSILSSGTKNAPGYDQAARSVACMANMVALARIKPKAMEKFAFHVFAPHHQIDAGVFGNLVTKPSILKKVRARVEQYQDEKYDLWFRETFQPVLERLDIGILSWESILDCLPTDAETSEVHEFYKLCLKFNPQRGNIAVYHHIAEGRTKL